MSTDEAGGRTKARERRDLEAQANAVRARLAAKLDALADRKRRLLNPTAELKRHPREALVIGGAAAVVVVAGAGIVAYRVSTQKERARQARWDAWARLLAHPERVPQKRPGFLLAVLEKTTSAIVVAAFAAVAKHALARLAEESTTQAESPRALLVSLPAPQARTDA